jgi:hypothetical protein
MMLQKFNLHEDYIFQKSFLKPPTNLLKVLEIKKPLFHLLTKQGLSKKIQLGNFIFLLKVIQLQKSAWKRV